MLTKEEIDAIYRHMKQNNFALNRIQMKNCIAQYRCAKENRDRATIAKINYYLNYINYRYELGFLSDGRYDELSEIVENW